MSDEPPPPTHFSVNQILEKIPHRYPFLLVDRVLEMNLEKGTIHAIKNVTINEGFFQGHFPGAPIMPGVLILEALAQAGGILVHHQAESDKIAVLLTVKEGKFRRPVLPGDVLHLHCDGIHFSTKGGKVKAWAMVDDKKVADAEIGFALVDREQIAT